MSSTRYIVMDAAARMSDYAAAIAAIEEAQGSWHGADWTHELAIDGRKVLDDDGEPIYCDGTEECQTCDDAEEDAAEAEDAARDALTSLRSGDVEEALRYLELAVRIENHWGDSPTYGPALDVLRAAHGAA